MLDGELRGHVGRRGHWAEEEDPCMGVSPKHYLAAIPTFLFGGLENAL